MAAPNRLAKEKSPYLLQHAHNPVDWFPWGEEAFEKARRENKPLFLSIGYATCHWCHVMERESFENEQVAQFLNAHFVPVKVDREERPDVDAVYMAAVQALTGQGGWPLSAFLTPDLKPFYAGAYFPPRDSFGRPAFLTILGEMARAWREQQSRVIQSSQQLTEHLKALEQTHAPREQLSDQVLETAYHVMVRQFDFDAGGFGGAPKFPRSVALDFLLRYARRHPHSDALELVQRTLDAMARGGIYDQLGGGFHRYSVDAQWRVPHFEKMLYDNALLARTYLDAYRLTRRELYAQIAAETLDYVLRDMTHPEGAFYSAEDADSEGHEGAYYVWNPSQLKAVLGEADAELAARYYGVSASGNFEQGQSVLYVARQVDDLAQGQNETPTATALRLANAKARLLEARGQRVRPGLDDKILTAWNGLTISALAHAYQVLGQARYLEAAQRAARFIQVHLVADGHMMTRWRDGEARYDAYLDDYAFWAQGLIDLYQSDFDPRWLEAATKAMDTLLGDFQDAQHGGFFFTGCRHESLIIRTKDPYDGAMPSGNSVAALNLLKLAELTDRQDYREAGLSTLRAFYPLFEEQPHAYPNGLCALDYAVHARQTVVVAGPMPDAQLLLKTVWRHFLPQTLVAYAEKRTESLIPAVQGRVAIDGRVTAYVCQDQTCRLPVTGPHDLEKELV